MIEPDIRWIQRLDHFSRTLTLLEEIVNIEDPSIAEKLGAIKLFEMTFELSWKLLKDYQEAEGFIVKSPRDSIRRAFQVGLIDNGHQWLEALKSRNLMIHTYDEFESVKVIEKIKNAYLPLLQNLRGTFEPKLKSLEEQ